MSRLLVPLFAVIFALMLGLAPWSSLLAQEDVKDKPAPPVKPEKKPKVVTEWEELKSARGALQKKPKEPMKIAFTSEGTAKARVKWTTKAVAGERGGSISMTLYKKKDGENERNPYQRLDRIGTARGESVGVKPINLSKGEYHIELDGSYTEYDITVEIAVRKEE